ncbi:hypothetical protein OSTOST_25815, partial [Ostertagia ostertagi]
MEDWRKEQRFINLENNLKTCLVSIEKKLHENGVLLDEDEELRAFFSNESRSEIAVAETGNELLNQRLPAFFLKRWATKNQRNCFCYASLLLFAFIFAFSILSFEELSEIMKEVRTEQGESSNIPDPDRECAAF